MKKNHLPVLHCKLSNSISELGRKGFIFLFNNERCRLVRLSDDCVKLVRLESYGAYQMDLLDFVECLFLGVCDFVSDADFDYDDEADYDDEVEEGLPL